MITKFPWNQAINHTTLFIYYLAGKTPVICGFSISNIAVVKVLNELLVTLGANL
jgi:hypothetical protein